MTSKGNTSNTTHPISKDEIAKAKAKIAASPIPEAPKVAKAKKTNPCICGCGTQTGGFFAPGHDARLHAWQRAIKADAKVEVPQVVKEALARWDAAIKAKAAAKAKAAVKTPVPAK